MPLRLCVRACAALLVAAGTVCFAAAAPHAQPGARANNIGVALMNQGLAEKALQHFADAGKLDPAPVEPQLNQAIALMYLQKLPEAKALANQVVERAPKTAAGWYVLGLIERTAGSTDAAIAAFEHAAAQAPSDADAHYFLGAALADAKRGDEAAAEFRRALALNPTHASAEFSLARVLQRQGKTDEARQRLQQFEEWMQNKISSPLTSVYGEQGTLARAQSIALPEQAVASMIPVRFEAQTMAGPFVQGRAIGGVAPSTAVGSAACVLDLKGTGIKDLVTVSSRGVRLFRNDAGVLKEMDAHGAGLPGGAGAVACAVGDFDGDRKADLAIAFADHVQMLRSKGDGSFEDVTAATGIRATMQPSSLTFVDYDHDGDLDLLITGGHNQMWRNNGDGTFTDVTNETGFADGEGSTEAVLSDLNNDRAVDLLISSRQAAPRWYANQRQGAFKAAAMYTEPGISGARGVAIVDANKDGWMDVALTHTSSPGISFWRNREGKSFERVPLPAAGVDAGFGVVALDIDNDGWIDLAAIVQTAAKTQLRVWRNEGSRGFVDVSEAVGVSRLDLHGATSLAVADMDGDGAADLLLTQADGTPLVLHNVGGAAHRSLRLQLAGLADNKSALGAKVEIFADGIAQKFEVTGGSGLQGQGAAEIVAGLGDAKEVDIVRVLWPTGVPQDEIEIAERPLLKLEELDRRGSSCPVVFAWDGVRYRFISDTIGAAVVGHWTSPTETNRQDADEWLKIDGDALQPRDGLLSVRLGEPMEEVNYVDQLRLVAVDHPAGTEAYPEEGFLSEPPFASGRTVAVRAPHAIARAWDDAGRDVTDLLRERDHRYVRDFANLRYDGFSKPHKLTLELGEWDARQPLRLLLDGYVEYFSASSMYAAWQAGLKPVPPFVEAQMPDGSWRRVVDDMGFPAGLPRTVVVDLSGKLPAGTRRIRLTTNLQIYWDRIRVDNAAAAPEKLQQTEVPLRSAHLAFRGYPQQIEGNTPGELTYNYDRISQTGPFHWARGSYTHFGDVTPLLTTLDDHPVVFGSGEEIDAEFAADALPALPAGWTRDYFFYANGFVKDMDFYEAMPFTVGAMPFHGMSRYPYPSGEAFPSDPAAVAYRLQWNDRFESGDRQQRDRFQYAPVKAHASTAAGSGIQ